MSGKFVMCVTGPMAMYRFDIMKKVFPDIIKDYVIVFTDTYSLNLYKDYYKDFNFVDFEEIRKDYDFSILNERFLQVPNEEEYYKKLLNFYYRDGARPDKKINLYSYDIQRFALPWLVNNNIKNFALVDNDYIISNDKDLINSYFDNIPINSLYNVWFAGGDLSSSDIKRLFFQKEVQPHFPGKGFDYSNMLTADGYIRGFKMEHTSEIKLFFDIWNKSIEKLYSDDFWMWNITGGNLMLDNFWVLPNIMGFFKAWGYNNLHSLELKHADKVGKHYTRVEDTLYYGKRSGWDRFNFDYSDTTCVSNFVKNNKEQLKEYYGPFETEVTDTHVYTALRKVPYEA